MLFRQIFRNASANDRDAWESLRSILGSHDDSDVRGKQSLKEATAYTCIKILSETLGKLPVKIYRDENGKRKATEHPLYPLLKLRPNPYMTAFAFWGCVETQRNVYGNAYVLMDTRRTGEIVGFYILESSRMRILVDDIGLLSSAQKVWYQYTNGAGEQRLINSDQVMHFKGLTTDGIVGLSPIEAVRATIENGKASTTLLRNSYRNGMQAGGILQYAGDLDEAGRGKLREKFESMASGVINAGRVAVMPLGVKFEPVQLKFTDAQFLENARFTVQQLTAAFGVKPHQVNDLTKSSYASVSESNREFYTDTMLALLTMYEQEISYKLFTEKEIQDGYYVKFNADVILRADTEKRYAMYKDAVQNMVMTPNECRALEENEPLPGGDVLFGNAALAPAELLARGAALRGGGENS